MSSPLTHSKQLESQPLRGSCLCGQVAFEFDLPFNRFAYCYCRRCRKASGTSRSSNLLVSPTQFRWLHGDEFAHRYDLPEAVSFSTRMCRECGSPVPRLTRSGREVIIPAGSLDDPLPSGPTEHTQWPSRANWVCLDESHLALTEE